jgi:hypothetical protein
MYTVVLSMAGVISTHPLQHLNEEDSSRTVLLIRSKRKLEIELGILKKKSELIFINNIQINAHQIFCSTMYFLFSFLPNVCVH